MGVRLFYVGVSMGDAIYLRIATATQSLKWLDKLGGHSSFKAEIVRSESFKIVPIHARTYV